MAILAVVLSGCYETDTTSLASGGFYRTNRITGQVVYCATIPRSAPVCVEMVGRIISSEEIEKNF